MVYLPWLGGGGGAIGYLTTKLGGGGGAGASPRIFHSFTIHPDFNPLFNWCNQKRYYNHLTLPSVTLRRLSSPWYKTMGSNFMHSYVERTCRLFIYLLSFKSFWTWFLNSILGKSVALQKRRIKWISPVEQALKFLFRLFYSWVRKILKIKMWASSENISRFQWQKSLS